MNISDIMFFLTVLSIIFFAIFYQLASKIIIKSPELRKALYGFDLYENRSMDISNIQAIMMIILIINVRYIFYTRKYGKSDFFDNSGSKEFPNLNSENALYIIKNYRKLWLYISIYGVSGLIFSGMGCFLLILAKL